MIEVFKMGFRFRKRINLGKGFRINMSKSGIGYSWGVKGFRITKTAKGTTRKTFSVPGTGISYVKETKIKKSNARNNNSDFLSANVIEGDVSGMISADLSNFLSVVKRRILSRKLIITIFWLYLFIFFAIVCYIDVVALPGSKDISTILSLVFFLIVIMLMWDFLRGGVKMDYDVDDDQKDVISERLDSLIKVTKCKKIWGVVERKKIADKRYYAGSSTSVKMLDFKASTKAPFPFKTSATVACFKMGKENLFFFPDKIFVIKGNEIGAFNYSDVSITFNFVKFVEEGQVPKDAEIIGNTWRYVTESGAPDKRFKNNDRLPVCLYGEFKLLSDFGLNVSVMFSNPNIVRKRDK